MAFCGSAGRPTLGVRVAVGKSFSAPRAAPGRSPRLSDARLTGAVRAPAKRAFAHHAHNTPAPKTEGKNVQPVPPGYAHATGPEKQQLTGEFYHGEVTHRGPFGTIDAPVIVESVFEHRTVGCEGGPTAAEEHELLWHNVWEEKPTICAECGQVFKLKRLDILEEEHDAAHH